MSSLYTTPLELPARVSTA